MEDIKPKDNNNRNHGYQQWYHNFAGYNGKLKLRVIYKHGVEIGYEEWHKIYTDSTTSFYII